MSRAVLEMEITYCLTTHPGVNPHVAAFDLRAGWPMSARPLRLSVFSPVVYLSLVGSGATFLGLSRIAKREFPLHSMHLAWNAYATSALDSWLQQELAVIPGTDQTESQVGVAATPMYWI